MSIELIIYLAGLLETIDSVRFFAGLLLFIGGSGYILNLSSDGAIWGKEIMDVLRCWLKRGVIIFLVLFLLPTQKTVYLMLGGHLAKEAVQTETAHKIQKIIDGKLDGYIKELESN